jgi:chromosome segregation ATPase
MADNKQLMFSVLVEAEQAIKDLAIYNRNIQNIDKSIEELRKQQKAEGADVQELEQRIVRMQQARKTYQKAIAESSKELQNSIKVNTLAEGSLAGLRAELSKLNAQYDNLSRTDREGDIGKGLQENINKVTKEIKDAEFATQRFYRNVGNYPNQLGMSVQQVARELPSLANGANQFFMAISNNLPILADNIKLARQEYAEAVAQGQQATPVWKQLLTSVISWQTALTVGITLLSVYGKDIIAFVGGLFKQKEAFDASAKAAEDYNKTMGEARTQGAKDVAQLQTLYHVATDVKRSIDLRREAVALLRREYPAYLQHLSDEEIMAGKAAGAYKLLRDQMLEMAKTRAIMDRVTELNSALLSREFDILKEATDAYSKRNVRNPLKTFYDAEAKDLREAAKAFEEAWGVSAKNSAEAEIVIRKTLEQLVGGFSTFRTELDKVTKETAPDGGTVKVLELDIEHLYDDINAVNAELDSIIAKQQAQAKALTQAIALATKGLANPFTALEEEYAQALDVIRRDTTLANDERVFYELALEVQLAKRKQELTEQLNRQQYQARVAQANKELQMAWRDADAQYKIKRDFLQKELQDARNSAEQRARLEQELAELNSQYAQQKIDNFSKYAQQVVQLGNSITELFKANEDAQLQKAEATNEAEKKSLKQKLDSGIISQKRYDREIARMDAELDAKKAKIAYNQAMREKALSVAQIAINTATAIAKIWAEVPKADFGATTIALTAMAAAMGVAQTAAVLATPIPKARKGGIVAGATHEQGGVLINTEDKERIISAKPAQAFPELLNLISYIGKHSSIPDTGFAARTLVSGSASSAPINADELAQKIGAQVGEAVRQMPIYLSLTELKEAQEEYARIEQSAKS